MSVSDKIERGREAFERGDFRDSFTLLRSADRDASLGPEELDILARAAYLTGEVSECIEFWTRAHRGFQNEFQNAGDPGRAARCAFWIGMTLYDSGESAQANGWIRRARRLIDEREVGGAERGYLLIPEARKSLGEGDPADALSLFEQVLTLGREAADADLQSMGLLGCGQALIRQSEIGQGTACFDEAMVAVISNELSPIVTGIVYCAVIDTCQKIHDVRRATEWTTAFSKWCDLRPQMIPYHGQCLVRRAQIMRLHGDWVDAIEEVRRVQKQYRRSNPLATGEALYLLAELQRLRGNFSDAEEAFEQASRQGRDCQPGLALLRLSQGRIDDAVAAMQRLDQEETDPISRARMLPACVEVMQAAGRDGPAQDAAEELARIAADLDAPLLRAMASRARGSLLLDEGEIGEALELFRQAWSGFRQLGASYESARTRVLIGRAYRALDDEDSAEMEFDAAAWMFRQLGASDALARLDSLIDDSPIGTSYGLTPREMEVLYLLATGKTNKAIGAELFISERTVDRHVSNILAKLDVPTRSAATAFAYEHDLIGQE